MLKNFVGWCLPRCFACLTLGIWLFSPEAIRGQTNGVFREVYSNIGGGSIPDLTNAPSFPAGADQAFLEPKFEAPANFSDNYGQRMRALLSPPVTGSYVFFIATDDGGVLYLSRDENPANKVAIAYESSWAAPRQYNLHPTQKSAPITLTNGYRYYIEALQKEGAGGDNLAVTWQKPGDPAPADNAEPIPGSYLVPFGLGPPVISGQPANQSVIEGGIAAFSVALTQKLGAAYQWRRNGTTIPGATNSNLVLSPVPLSENGSRYGCYIANAYGATNSTEATLTVTADITKPALTSATSLGDPYTLIVLFSEPVEPASATSPINYTINGGVNVLSAAFGLDTRTIILTTTAKAQATTYTLTVNNVRDRAVIPNVIVANSQTTFTLDWSPLSISELLPLPEAIGPASRHGPLVVSEIMYHPAPDLNGRDLEYIELYNSNPHYEDISGFRVSGEVDFTFPPNTLMPGRSFLVLAAAPADVQTAYGLAGVVGPYTNKLSNGSGRIRLRNRQGAILFEANYSSKAPWPAAADGAGHSLVLAWPSLGERLPNAWAPSDRIGGSPGAGESALFNPRRPVLINEYLAHTDLPDLDYIELFNYSAAAIDLSGCVLTDDPSTNKFVLPLNSVIPARGFLAFNETQLGYRLSAAGETLYLKDPDGVRVIDSVRFEGQENGVPSGRYPDGATEFYRLETQTFGLPNSRLRVSNVVINEIMYAPISDDDQDQYVELYNRGGGAVDVGGWSFQAGIDYTIPQGTLISGGGYLVIARNAARLMTSYPNLTGANTVGDFSGALSRGGERVALAMPHLDVTTNSQGGWVTNVLPIVVDEVSYRRGGRWGNWSGVGGSSLELKDPRADHRLAPNWADSDETAKNQWKTIEATGTLDNGNGDCDSLQVFLLGAGECLVDNVEVMVVGGQNLVTNGGFESGLTGWVPQGNHEDSSLEIGQGYSSPRSLHVRATDHGDTGANRIRTKLATMLSPGQQVTIRARVRWLAGDPEILLRLRGNWHEATGNMLTTTQLGTPGGPNSRAAANAGPAITDVKHSPVLPSPSQAVTVVARVQDPDGLAGLYLKYRVDPSTNFNLVMMVNNGAGLYSATIPGQASGTLAAFHIQAMDNHAVRASSLFPNDAPKRECLVRWGDPAQGGGFGTYRVWMTKATFDRWSEREHLSNKPLDCTFVYGNSRVIYNIGGQYSGSPWHAPGFNTPTGNVCDYLLTFPEDDRLLGEEDATLQWPGNGGGDNSYQREQTAYWLAEQMGLPYCYRRSINLFVNGVRRAEFLEDAQQPGGDMLDEFFPDGQNGDLHKIQIWFEFDDFAVGFNSVGASLGNFLSGTEKKLARYRWNFAKRAVHGSANNYTNLFKLVDAANYSGLGAAYRRQLESQLDVDNWLKTHAVEHIVGNNDSFSYWGGQNMYTCKPMGDTWKLLIWDIDFAFSSLPPTSDVFEGIARSNGIDLGEPGYARRYWQVLQDFVNGPLTGAKLFPLLDAKYNAMVANGRAVDNPAGIKTYISQRRAALLNLLTNVASNFSITLNGGGGFSTGSSLVNLTGTAPIDVRTITINGVAVPVTWQTVSNWTAQVALAPGQNVLAVRGWNAAGGQAAGASTSIAITYTGPVERLQDKVVINEIMYHPAAPDASYVELYNTSSFCAFDLAGWELQGTGFIFPGGSVIPPNSYLVVAGNRLGFAAAYGSTIAVAGEFSGDLQNNGETLRLVKSGATPAADIVADEVRYGSQAPWPASANGGGASLQLIDPAQDNTRVVNWAAVPSNAPPAGPTWRYVAIQGTASSSTLYIYLQSAGETYLDDIKLVPGTVPEAGVNALSNGDFESAFPGPWGVSTNLAGSGISTAVKHSGTGSLHVLATSGGASRTTAIYQDMTPALEFNGPYTLSFWVLENAAGGTLFVRLAGSGIQATVDLLPPVNNQLARHTPGALNSVRAALPPIPPLWLNEILPNNISGATDRFGHRHPWVELYNPATNNVNLAGLFLANNYSNLTQWVFPPGSMIGAGQRQLVWLDGNPGETGAGELHAGFTIPANTGSLALVSTNSGRTNVLDYIDYSLTRADWSFGSYPDGQGIRRRPFFYTTPGGTNNPASPPLRVFINEWMADNMVTLVDPADGDYEDWFEIYNPGDTTADLSGFYFGPSLTNKTKFKIPDGWTIPPHGYLLVWADDETGQNVPTPSDRHINFRLSKAGNAIGLFGADGSVVDYVAFGPQTTDISEGRYPDGEPGIEPLSRPTPRDPNYLTTPNHAPVFGVITNRTVFEGQMLVMTVPATDVDAPPQELTFSLSSGAPANAALNPDTGLFSWRPTLAQAPGTYHITVQVRDDGEPPRSATTTFAVQVLPRPNITAVSPNDHGCWISFTTVSGRKYRVEYTDALEGSPWLPLGPDVTAQSSSLLMNDGTRSTTARFYRIRALE